MIGEDDMRKIAVILLISYIFIIFGCSTADKEQETLTIYTSLYQDHAIAAIEAFEKETGIQVNFTRLSGGEILERIRLEQDDPKASIWFGGPVDTFIHAKQEKLLKPYKSENRKFIDERYKDDEGYWTGIYAGSLAIVSNRLWLQQKGLSVPQSWEDLLKPEFSGMVTMPNPTTSGTGYTILATLVQALGEDEAYSYLQQLEQQVVLRTTSGSTAGRLVGMRDMGVAVLFAHDAVKFFNEGFKEIVISFPKEGTGYEIGAVAILNEAPELEKAKQFVDWTLTKYAQEIGKQMGNYHLLTHEHAISPMEAFPLEELNVVDYDHQWAGEQRQRLLDRWKQDVFRR